MSTWGGRRAAIPPMRAGLAFRHLSRAEIDREYTPERIAWLLERARWTSDLRREVDSII